jgi:hypothetical protein
MGKPFPDRQPRPKRVPAHAAGGASWKEDATPSKARIADAHGAARRDPEAAWSRAAAANAGRKSGGGRRARKEAGPAD